MLEVINDFLSGKVLIVLIVGLGGYFTIRSRFVQLRHFFHMFSVFKDSLKSSAGQLSSFQALMLSLAGRVGAGNIAGVGIAVTLGGPGAVFWMWVTALNPYIGYENATRIARIALESGRGVLELVREEGLLDDAMLDDILRPENMIAPRLVPLKA